MFQVHARYLMSVAVLCVLMASVGCRNNCNPTGFGPCNSICGGAGFAGPTTVPSPSTFNYQIPSNAAAGAYYNRNAATASAAGLLQPRGVAPTTGTTTGATPSLAPQSLWREAGTGASQAPAANPNLGSATRTSQPQQPQQFVAAQPASSVLNNPNTRLARVAQPGTGQTNGLSFRDSQNYTTTTIDERRDPTRLAATDATNVRAPVQPVQNFGAPTRFAAVPRYATPVAQAPLAQTQYIQDPRLAQAPTYQGTPVFAGQRVYQGAPTVANNIIPGRVEYYPQAGFQAFSQPAPQTYPGLTSSSPTVLAQSTVFSNPSGSASGPATTTAGWRDSTQLNR